MQNDPIKRFHDFQNQERDRQKQTEQITKDVLTTLLGSLVGAKVVPSSLYEQEKLKYENELKQAQSTNAELADVNKQLQYLALRNCKLQSFVNYHSEWKPLTKGIKAREKKLRSLNLDQIPEHLSDILHKNLSQALRCYVMNLATPCYMMILRSIELAISELYDKHHPPVMNTKTGKPNIISAKNKLDWAESKKYVGGMDYKMAKAAIETRNEAIHEFVEPTELQLFSSIEMIFKVLEKLK